MHSRMLKYSLILRKHFNTTSLPVPRGTRYFVCNMFNYPLLRVSSIISYHSCMSHGYEVDKVWANGLRPARPWDLLSIHLAFICYYLSSRSSFLTSLLNIIIILILPMWLRHVRMGWFATTFMLIIRYSGETHPFGMSVAVAPSSLHTISHWDR